MVRKDKDFVVYDAKSGDDLTHAVLTQIIVEQESREGGQTLLPIPFLRQLIRFYDDNIGTMVPSYLQFSLENLVKEQEKFRTMFASAFSNPAAAFEAYQDQARKNMAMFEQAMSMWTSFGGVAKFQAQADRDEVTAREAAQGAAPQRHRRASARSTSSRRSWMPCSSASNGWRAAAANKPIRLSAGSYRSGAPVRGGRLWRSAGALRSSRGPRRASAARRRSPAGSPHPLRAGRSPLPRSRPTRLPSQGPCCGPCRSSSWR